MFLIIGIFLYMFGLAFLFILILCSETSKSPPQYGSGYRQDIKPFREQYIECYNNGLIIDGEFLTFEKHPELLPLFPNRKMIEAINSGEWKGIQTLKCGKFGGKCNSGHKKCRKMRGYKDE